jgi:hypothetical protein
LGGREKEREREIPSADEDHDLIGSRGIEDIPQCREEK